MARSLYEDIRDVRSRNEPEHVIQELPKKSDDRQNGSDFDFSPVTRYPELDEYSREQNVYRIDRERYSLRQSELYTLAEAGKFRAITLENLSRYLYSTNTDLMERDLRDLQRHGLIRLRSVRFLETIRVVSLTRRAAKFLRQVSKKSD